MGNVVREKILKEMRVLPEIDVRNEIARRVDFMEEYLYLTGTKTLVLGISGGQDSTLLGKLAQMAVDNLNKVRETDMYEFIAVRLPYGEQKDEADCQMAIDFIKPSRVYTVNIKDEVDAGMAALKTSGIEISDFIKGNYKARSRMQVQYAIAGTTKGLVLGTDHSAESVTGFFTKYGDGGADIVPLFGLNKRQGKAMLKKLGCPEALYLKRPTADLEDDKPQLADEDALGMTYVMIDDYLEGREISEDLAKKLEDRFVLTMHKRELPVTIYDNI